MAARRRAVAHLTPGTVATHTPTGQRVTVAWESRGSAGRKGPWYWVAFPEPVPGVTETNADGKHLATVHGSTLSYTGMAPRQNPFDGSARQSFAAVPKIEAGTVIRYTPGAGRGVRAKAQDGIALDVPDSYGQFSVRWSDGSLSMVSVRSVLAGKVDGTTERLEVVPRQNPPLVIMGNPGHARGRTLSQRAISIRYVHATDGKSYEHKFGKGDVIELLADGSFRVYNARGKRLWKDFT